MSRKGNEPVRAVEGTHYWAGASSQSFVSTDGTPSTPAEQAAITALSRD